MIENLTISDFFSILVISTKQITQKIAIITESKITEFFCIADDFCKIFNQKIQKYTFKANTKRNYHRDSILSIAEVMTIIVMFHSSGYKLNKEGTTIIMVTHSRHDAQYADRIINLFDGEIVNQVEI